MPTDSPKKILTDAEMEAIVTKHAQESNPYPEVARIAASHVAVSKALKNTQRLLEGLTPGGSEFFNDPERCAAFVRERLAGPFGTVKQKLEQAEARIEQLETALLRIKTRTVCLCSQSGNCGRCMAEQ